MTNRFAQPLSPDAFLTGVRLHFLSEGTCAMARAYLLLDQRPPPRDILAEAPAFRADGYAVCILLGWFPTPRGWADAFAGERIPVVALPNREPDSEPAMALAMMRAFGVPGRKAEDLCLSALLGFRDELPA